MDLNDVSPYEMSGFDNIGDSDLEALRAGQVPTDDKRLGDLAGFFRDFAEAHPEPSTEQCEASHIALMLDAAHLLADKGDPAAMPASKGDGPETQASGLPKPREKTMIDKIVTAPLGAKIAAGAAALMLTFSGVAAAGALPGPVQDATADLAATAVGVDLPGGSDETAVEVDDVVVGGGSLDTTGAVDPGAGGGSIDADDDTDEADGVQSRSLNDADEGDEDTDEAEEADDEADDDDSGEAEEAADHTDDGDRSSSVGGDDDSDDDKRPAADQRDDSDEDEDERPARQSEDDDDDDSPVKPDDSDNEDSSSSN
ncbi:MAG: hypothetical protein HY876_04535 [Coriobacteriales bacterium]|nr:hypothetical protein [Coriobacteriales bacterium]